MACCMADASTATPARLSSKPRWRRPRCARPTADRRDGAETTGERSSHGVRASDRPTTARSTIARSSGLQLRNSHLAPRPPWRNAHNIRNRCGTSSCPCGEKWPASARATGTSEFASAARCCNRRRVWRTCLLRLVWVRPAAGRWSAGQVGELRGRAFWPGDDGVDAARVPMHAVVFVAFADVGPVGHVHRHAVLAIRCRETTDRRRTPCGLPTDAGAPSRWSRSTLMRRPCMFNVNTDRDTRRANPRPGRSSPACDRRRSVVD